MAEPPRSPPRRVRIDAPARLHLGVLDLRREGGRYFGGMGVAVDRPRVRLVLRPSRELEVEGPEADVVRRAARRHLERPAGTSGARIRVEATVPRHVGLGSGTQLALAVGRGLDLLRGRRRTAGELARALERGRRSAVGTWLFAHGGFVLEGGVRRDGDEGIAPLLARFELPGSWRAVLVRPPVPDGLSGDREEAAFRELPPPEPDRARRVAHVVLMELLPALAEGDLEGFGRAAAEVERATGDAFRPAQEGRRHAHEEVAEAVEALRGLGAAGVGQSSWGPTVYGFVDGQDDARRAVEALTRRHPGWSATVAGLDNRGAREEVEREE